MLQKELAKLITLEQGKTLADAEGDVFRGLRKSQGSFKRPVIESKKQTYWSLVSVPLCIIGEPGFQKI